MKRLILLFTLFTICGLLSVAGCQTPNYNNIDGVSYYGQAKYEDALRAFQTARSVNPDDADAYYNIGATYYRLGTIAKRSGQQELAVKQLTSAEENYKAAILKDPNHTAAYRGLATMWCELGHTGEAFELLRNWTQLSPTNADAKIELARLYQEHGKPPEAQQLLQSALASDPSNARALRALGYYGELAGRADVALDHYRRSLSADPNQKDLADHVARIETTALSPTAVPYGYTPGIPQQSTATVATGSSPTASVYPGESTSRSAAANRVSPF